MTVFDDITLEKVQAKPRHHEWCQSKTQKRATYSRNAWLCHAPSAEGQLIPLPPLAHA
jgi:hypothetical protein